MDVFNIVVNKDEIEILVALGVETDSLRLQTFHARKVALGAFPSKEMAMLCKPPESWTID
jgi:hypothetical protein